MKKTIASLLFALLFLAQNIFAQLYSVTEFPTLGGSAIQGHGMNNSDVITGISTNSSGSPVAFITVSGVPVDMGISDFFVEGEDLNNSGQAVATSLDLLGNLKGYYYQGGSATMLPTLGGNTTAPFAVNDSGVIAGFATSPSSSGELFTYIIGSSVALNDLGRPPGAAGSIGVNDINNPGSIVGYYVNSSSANQAFVYTVGTYTSLGTLGGTSSVANAISDGGIIVGFSLDSGGNMHAFRYSGAMTDLGTIGGTSSNARDINSAGIIVGQATTSGGVQHAFVYSGGVMTDLNSLINPALGDTLVDAVAVNSLGQILVNGQNSGGQPRTFILTVVPEPSTCALLPPHFSPNLFAASGTFSPSSVN